MAAPPKPELEEAFEERVDILFRELDLSIRFNRPSILLAIYSSEFVRAEAEAALTAKLRGLNQTVTSYRVTGEENADIPLHLSQSPDRAGTVFFVSGLRGGGGADGRNAYRALNLRREYFVDLRLRAMFWLTENEAVALPNDAPDFWAFRHRVVEFVEPPELERIAPVARELAWRDLEDRTLREDTDAKIALREALLADLPIGDETLAARADLLYTLAALYQAKGEYEKAIDLRQQTLSIAERLRNARLQAGCYNGLGNAYRALGRHDDAIAEYQRAIELDPKRAAPHNGLGNVYRDLGRYEEAIAEYQERIRISPDDAQYGHSGLGITYQLLGRLEEAKAAFQRAVELQPRAGGYHASLASVCRKLGHRAEYDEQVRIARELMTKENEYSRACFESICGNVDEALGLLKVALEKKQVSLEWARRDPDFDFIRGDPRFKALVGE